MIIFITQKKDMKKQKEVLSELSAEDEALFSLISY